MTLWDSLISGSLTIGYEHQDHEIREIYLFKNFRHRLPNEFSYLSWIVLRQVMTSRSRATLALRNAGRSPTSTAIYLLKFFSFWLSILTRTNSADIITS